MLTGKDPNLQYGISSDAETTLDEPVGSGTHYGMPQQMPVYSGVAPEQGMAISRDAATSEDESGYAFGAPDWSNFNIAAPTVSQSSAETGFFVTRDAPTEGSDDPFGAFSAGSVPMANKPSNMGMSQQPSLADAGWNTGLPQQSFQGVRFFDDSNSRPVAPQNEANEQPARSAAVESRPAQPVFFDGGNAPASANPMPNTGTRTQPGRQEMRQNVERPAPAPISPNAHRSMPAPQPVLRDAKKAVPQVERYHTYNERRDEAKQKFDVEMAQYNAQKKELKQNIWILPVSIAALAVIAILIAALLGWAAMLIFLLLIGLAIAVLAVTGKLSWLKIKKKPKVAQFQMQPPEMVDIHSVHICLRSRNLATPVEITIRDAVQYIGSDDKLCRVPLHFKGVSHRHLTITSQSRSGNTQYFVTDQGSKTVPSSTGRL